MIHWDLDKITGLKRVYLKKPVSIGLAINTMKNKKINDIAVVDDNLEFKMILTKEELNSQITSKLYSI